MAKLIINKDRKIIQRGNKLASSLACCCCEYDVEVTLDWVGDADLDLYVKQEDRRPIFFGSHSDGQLSLNHDAHPVCNPSPLQPEIISGHLTGDHVLSVWYNQYSNCNAEESPTTTEIRITNRSSTNICINGTNVAPGADYTSNTIAYAGYNTGQVSEFTGGSIFQIKCSPCL